MTSGGPLAGYHVVELSGVGPAPYGTMLLADLGAEVIRIDRLSSVAEGYETESSMLGVSRNRRSIALDLKSSAGLAILLDLIDRADVLIEGYRPGVAERLGFGPDVCMKRNIGLVYARMTGWGQTGPLRQRAGHDINYAAVAGALHQIGHADRPPSPPLSYIGDLGGGGTFLAIGVCAALLERERSGTGQVLDVAMVDGAGSLTALFHGLMRAGAWTTQRQNNLVDGGAPYYGCYECADGRYIAVGALEPQFYQEFLTTLGLDAAQYPQRDRTRWPEYRQRFADVIRTRTREEWADEFVSRDACVSPVLALDEAPKHTQAVARDGFVARGVGFEPAPAPRFSRTPATLRRDAPRHGQHTEEILAELGYDESRRRGLLDEGVVAAQP